VIDLGTCRTRDAIVRELFAEPHVEWHARGLARQTGEAIANVHRELRRLDRSGWLVKRREANRILYRIDEEHPLYFEMRGLVAKTVGVGSVLAAALHGVGGVVHASYLELPGEGRPSVSGALHVVVVGGADPAAVAAALRPAAQWLGRPISSDVYSVNDLRRGLSRRDPYMVRLLGSRRMTLLGDERQLRALAGDALGAGPRPEG
jgi:hypothetical protein